MASKRPGLPRERKMVKYNGVTLRRPDIEILNGPYFLNDRIIDFYFTYLDEFLDSSSKLLLLPPSVTLWIKHTPIENESLQEFIELLHLPGRKIIVLPILNEDKNLKDKPEGGKHWSLLVFVRSKNAFIHYDSSKENINRSDADQVCEVLRPYVSILSEEYVPADFVQYAKTPKQKEPWECGGYIMTFARIICRWYRRNEPKDNTSDEKLWIPGIEAIQPSQVSSLRSEVMEIFKGLMKRQKPNIKTKRYTLTNTIRCKALIEDMKDEILQDEVVVTYNGVAVRMDDFDTLEDPFFITDRAIEFYFSYLTSSINSDEILLVPPTIIFWLKDGPHDEQSLMNYPDPFLPLNPSKRKIIIFPLINEDRKISTTIGGNHWSLLVFDRSSNVFVHHDSSEQNQNATLAETMYEAVSHYVSTSSSESDALTFMEHPKTPKQKDPGDCGVYVLAIAKAICTWYTSRSGSSGSGGSGSSSSAAKNTGELWFAEVEQITPSLISSLRPDVQELIANLVLDK